MITNFKLFEEYVIDWGLGTYVLVNLKDINDPTIHGLPDTEYTFGKITEYLGDDDFPYEVTLSNGVKFRFHDNEIERYLTPEEVESYELLSQTKKYNL